MPDKVTPAYPVFKSYCGCSVKEPKYMRDCYYFYEEPDMGAHIPFCTKSAIDVYDPPNCNKNCPHYISNAEVRKMVKEKQTERTVWNDGSR